MTDRISTLPTTLDAITPEWLSEALSQRSPGTMVNTVTVESVIWGTASKVFLEVEYAERPTGGPPEALCLKGGFNDDMRAIVGVGYCTEALFYRDVGPIFGTSLPRCWYAEADTAGNQGLILTDDLRTVDALFGQPHDKHPVDRIAVTLEILAGFHGATWNRAGVGQLQWLTVGSGLLRPFVKTYFVEEYWNDYMGRRPTAGFSEELRNMRRVERAMHRVWELDDADVLSVSHGDAHIGNTYVVGDGPMRFVDWQTVCLAPWSDDFSYFLVGALEVEDRRKHEQDLLSHYLQALAAAGASAPSFADAWLAYRRHHLHGVLFALCPPEMQSPEVCTILGDRYAAAAIDHDTLAALED